MSPPNNLLFHCLLGNGFLPEYMPPPFTSQNFADYADSFWPNISSTLQVKGSPKGIAEAGRFYHPRAGGSRRHFSICNPIAYAGLAEEIVIEQSHLAPHLRNNVSLTIPDLTPSSVSHEVRQYPLNITREGRQIAARGSARYLLQMDIAQFFGSIYTHSLEWLFAGKSSAKSQKHKKLSAVSSDIAAARKIDQRVRACNDAQTTGVPIGPHTSHIIAEAILGDVDNLAGLTSKNALRITDDYEIYCKDRTEIEDTKARVQEALYLYELSINDAKTEVSELPIPIESRWVHKLRSIDVKGTVRQQRSNLIRLFDEAYRLFKHDNAPYGISFAINMIDPRELHYENAFLAIDLMRHCISTDPSSMHKAIRFLIDVQVASRDHSDPVQETIHSIIDRNVHARHGSEVAWAVWLAFTLDIALDREFIHKALGLGEQCVTLICLDLDRSGLVNGSLDRSLVQGDVSEDALYERDWLLAYEARLKKWLDRYFGVYGKPIADPAFEGMRRAGVSFYESADPSTATIRHRMTLPRWRRDVAYQ